jgi:hypothetical protein
MPLDIKLIYWSRFHRFSMRIPIARAGSLPGSIVLSLCPTAHLLHTGLMKMIDASVSEAAVLPEP